MKKRIIPILLGAVLAASACLMTACGGSSENEITLVASTSTREYIQAVCDAYNAQNPEVPVRPLYNANQDGFISAKKAPDLIFTNNLDAENKYHYVLEDLAPYIEAENFDTSIYYEDVIDSLYTPDGTIRGLPVTCNLSLLYYNKTMFDDYNEGKAESEKLSYPDETWTLADFADACEKLTIPSGAGVAQYGAELTDNWWGEWLIYVRSYGGDFMNEDETDIALDSEAAKQGFEFMYDLYLSGHATRVPNQFSAGEAAMLMGGHVGNWLSYNALEGFEWDVAPLPTLNEGERLATSEITADVYGISNTSKHKDAAWDFLKFLTGYEGQKIINDTVSSVSCLKQIGQEKMQTEKSERPNPQNLEAIYDVQLNYVEPLPTYRYFRTMHDNYVAPCVTRLFEGQYASAGSSAAEQVEAMVAEACADARNYMRNPS